MAEMRPNARASDASSWAAHPPPSLHPWPPHAPACFAFCPSEGAGCGRHDLCLTSRGLGSQCGDGRQWTRGQKRLQDEAVAPGTMGGWERPRGAAGEAMPRRAGGARAAGGGQAGAVATCADAQSSDTHRQSVLVGPLSPWRLCQSRFSRMHMYAEGGLC